jgi:hypothetical protein
MTDATDSGTDPFPAAGITTYISKSEYTNGGARQWLIVGTDKAAFLWVKVLDNVTYSATSYFGDLKSYKPTPDPYCAHICAGIATTSYYNSMMPLHGFSGCYTARGVSGVVGAVNPYCHFPVHPSQYSGRTSNAYPDAVTGGFALNRRLVHDTNSQYSALRGELLGVLGVGHSNSTLSHWATVPPGPYTKAALLLSVAAYTTPDAFLAVEVDGPW